MSTQAGPDDDPGRGEVGAGHRSNRVDTPLLGRFASSDLTSVLMNERRRDQDREVRA